MTRLGLCPPSSADPTATPLYRDAFTLSQTWSPPGETTPFRNQRGGAKPYTAPSAVNCLVYLQDILSDGANGALAGTLREALAGAHAGALAGALAAAGALAWALGRRWGRVGAAGPPRDGRALRAGESASR